jgi:rhamnogalacturonyl hydrolase YesR
LYLIQKDEALLKLGKNAADYNITKGGWVRNAIDDTYMTGSLMVQAYRATNDTKYLNFAAKFIRDYMGKLQQSNGLFWHMPDSKNFWGRGNGWGAASTTELLQELPDTNENYAAVMEGYKKQMKGLLAAQKASGMWMQLLDTDATNNWEESSGTAMFLFAIFTGLKNRCLDDATYLEPAKKGWMALAGYVQNGKLGNVAAGFWPKSKTASEYLNAAKGQPGDSHGTAAILWAATAAIKYLTSTGVQFEPGSARHFPSRRAGSDGNGRAISFNVLGQALVSDWSTKPLSSGAGIVLVPGAKAEKRVLIPR